MITEHQVAQAKRYITQMVRLGCKYHYDDPETGEADQCYKFGGIHCITIDSLYGYLEKGKSICQHFNTMPPVGGIQPPTGTRKVCAYCHTEFNPVSNRQKYCASCLHIAKRIKGSARQRAFKAKTK